MNKIFLATAILFLLITNKLYAQQNTVAQTPPMGWNSYNCFGSAVHEDEVKANADYIAKNLKQYGWQYIVVDFLWSYDNPPSSISATRFKCNCRMVRMCRGNNGQRWKAASPANKIPFSIWRQRI